MIATTASAISHVCKDAHLRECTFDDYPQVAAVTARNGIQTECLEWWKHLWIGNPAYREVEGRWPIGWVIDDGNGKLVGYLGNIPLGYVYRGRKLLAATSRSWVVDAAYRGYALLLLDRHFTQGDVDLFIHPTVNAQ